MCVVCALVYVMQVPVHPVSFLEQEVKALSQHLARGNEEKKERQLTVRPRCKENQILRFNVLDFQIPEKMAIVIATTLFFFVSVGLLMYFELGKK